MLELDLKKGFPGFSLKVSCSVGQELLVLFGPCGAGKSLTLKLIAGLERPDAGLIRLNGRLVFDSTHRVNLPIHKRRVGYVSQNYALFPHLRVAENVAYGLAGLPLRQAKERVAQLLSLMRLESWARLYPGQLSAGQQQQVALARALATQPDILLLDEPFSSLDTPTRKELRLQLLELVRRLTIPAVFVTHDLAEAYALADKMLVMDQGQVLQQGTREEVFHQPASAQVAQLTSVTNILTGIVSHLEEDSVFLFWKGYLIEAELKPDRARPLIPGSPISFCIRPENVMFVKETPGIWSSPPANVIPGIIVREVSHGATYILYFKAGKSPDYLSQKYDLEIEIQAHAYSRLGLHHLKSCAVSLRKERIYIFPVHD